MQKRKEVRIWFFSYQSLRAHMTVFYTGQVSKTATCFLFDFISLVCRSHKTPLTKKNHFINKSPITISTTITTSPNTALHPNGFWPHIICSSTLQWNVLILTIIIIPITLGTIVGLLFGMHMCLLLLPLHLLHSTEHILNY